MRRIGLPVADRATASLRFRLWYPGCEIELDAYDIPKPKDTDEFVPQMLVVPCLGFGPGGVRLGYGGGFFDRTLRALKPRPMTVGVSFTQASCRCCGRARRPAARCPADRGRRDVAASGLGRLTTTSGIVDRVKAMPLDAPEELQRPRRCRPGQRRGRSCDG